MLALFLLSVAAPPEAALLDDASAYVYIALDDRSLAADKELAAPFRELAGVDFFDHTDALGVDRTGFALGSHGAVDPRSLAKTLRAKSIEAAVRREPKMQARLWLPLRKGHKAKQALTEVLAKHDGLAWPTKGKAPGWAKLPKKSSADYVFRTKTGVGLIDLEATQMMITLHFGGIEAKPRTGSEATRQFLERAHFFGSKSAYAMRADANVRMVTYAQTLMAIGAIGVADPSEKSKLWSHAKTNLATLDTLASKSRVLDGMFSAGGVIGWTVTKAGLDVLGRPLDLRGLPDRLKPDEPFHNGRALGALAGLEITSLLESLFWPELIVLESKMGGSKILDQFEKLSLSLDRDTATLETRSR